MAPTRRNLGSIVAGIVAAGFLATAVLHGTGYDAVTRLAEQAPEGLRPLIPALWLSFSFDLTVVGLIVAVIAARRSAVGRPVLVIAALCPIGAAALQLRFIGFIPPTGILLALAGLTLVAAAIITDEEGKKA